MIIDMALWQKNHGGEQKSHPLRPSYFCPVPGFLSHGYNCHKAGISTPHLPVTYIFGTRGSSYLIYWQLGAWFQIYRERTEDQGTTAYNCLHFFAAGGWGKDLFLFAGSTGSADHYSWQVFSSWWFFTNPFEKYARQNGFIFPNLRGENSKNIWVATTQFSDFGWKWTYQRGGGFDSPKGKNGCIGWPPTFTKSSQESQPGGLWAKTG